MRRGQNDPSRNDASYSSLMLLFSYAMLFVRSLGDLGIYLGADLMLPDRPMRKIRLPVQLVEGKWEFKLGGEVPFAEGTNAELIVDRCSISDPALLHILEVDQFHKILEEKTELLICLRTRDGYRSPPHLSNILVPFERISKDIFMLCKADYKHVFAPVKIGAPAPKHIRSYDSARGGLWLLTKGLEAVGLGSTTIELPPGVRAENASSINHAYTILSETFEPWRISHTGNIYEQVFYREINRRWYPLEILRNRALQKAEHEIAQSHWLAFLTSMKNTAFP